MTVFQDAPAVFGPQKGASAAEIGLLEGHLAALAERFLATQAIDVRSFRGRAPPAASAAGSRRSEPASYPGSTSSPMPSASRPPWPRAQA